MWEKFDQRMWRADFAEYFLAHPDLEEVILGHRLRIWKGPRRSIDPPIHGNSTTVILVSDFTRFYLCLWGDK